MGQSMSVLVVLASKTLLVIVTSYNGTFFGPFGLMGKHVGFQVLEKSATVDVWTTAPLSTVFVESNAGGPWAVLRVA